MIIKIKRTNHSYRLDSCLSQLTSFFNDLAPSCDKVAMIVWAQMYAFQVKFTSTKTKLALNFRPHKKPTV